MSNKKVAIISSDNLLLESLLEFWSDSVLEEVEIKLVSDNQDQGVRLCLMAGH